MLVYFYTCTFNNSINLQTTENAIINERLTVNGTSPHQHVQCGICRTNLLQAIVKSVCISYHHWLAVHIYNAHWAAPKRSVELTK